MANLMWHYLTVSIVLAKGGSKLETTTAQLARKSSVWPENNFLANYAVAVSSLPPPLAETETPSLSLSLKP